MEFSVEKFVSNFVENQFPQFYQEEGENFILFTKAYYEWMESNGNPIGEARKLLDYRDIDNTVESFLEHFQKKYLYGIPFKVIADKRLLLKHVLDVYRSKGSITCYKLLFKLVYNENIEIYLPGVDILRVSDGDWIEPQYIEVTNFNFTNDFIGKTIIGTNSGTTAVVENIVKETYSKNNSVSLIYFSNINPKGGFFEIGEKVVPVDKKTNYQYTSTCPVVLGSIYSLDVKFGGRDYKLNDTVRIVERDPVTKEIKTYGKDGYLKITGLKDGEGEMYFELLDGGFGFAQNSEIFIYRNDNIGSGASFEIGSIINEVSVEYNTDIVSDFLEKSLNVPTYNFSGYPSANLNSTIGETLSYNTNIFGTIGSLANVNIGKNYQKPVNVFVRSVTLSEPINANVSYDTGSNTVTFTSAEQISTYANILLNAPAYGFPRNPQANVYSILQDTISLTNFYNLLKANDVICLQANATNSTTQELQVIKEISSLNSLTLYGPPKFNSTPSAFFRAAAVIFPSNFVLSDPLMDSPNELVNGLNEKIRTFAAVGKNMATSAIAYTGKGFLENEWVDAGLYGVVSDQVEILSPGTNYSNSDVLVFSYVPNARSANGYIVTNDSGQIIDVVITNNGSGYNVAPELKIITKTGNNASLRISLQEFNPDTVLSGRVRKAGNGKEFGYYATTKGFLNSDKYVQDSYYYQDYSYEIRVGKSLDKYKNILYETFHTAGSELFGKYLSFGEGDSVSKILYENNSANISQE